MSSISRSAFSSLSARSRSAASSASAFSARDFSQDQSISVSAWARISRSTSALRRSTSSSSRRISAENQPPASSLFRAAPKSLTDIVSPRRVPEYTSHAPHHVPAPSPNAQPHVLPLSIETPARFDSHPVDRSRPRPSPHAHSPPHTILLDPVLRALPYPLEIDIQPGRIVPQPGQMLHVLADAAAVDQDAARIDGQQRDDHIQPAVLT